MAKAPRAGDVKTRLCPPLTVAEAADLYRAFLLDKIEQVGSLQALDVIAKPDTDLVLGPCEDGGYYLVGMRAARPELFEGVPWSTSGVLPETTRRARDLGLGVAWLPRWFDVDTGPDLERLRDS